MFAVGAIAAVIETPKVCVREGKRVGVLWLSTSPPPLHPLTPFFFSLFSQFLAFTFLPATAAWAPFIAKLLGSNYIMLAAATASLQQLHQSGLGASPAGEALTLGLLASAAFRGLHLALYRPFYTQAAWGVQAVGVGVVVALVAALYSSIAAPTDEAGAAPDAVPRAGLASLAPKPGVPLSAGYALAAVVFLVGGVIMGALPPSIPARAFAGGDPGALLTAMRGSFASGVVFPGAVAAWVLKDAADAGTLGWPAVRALNVGLLAASVTRGVAVFMAAQAGVLSGSAPWPVPVAIHASLALVAAGGLVKGGWGAV